MTLRERACSISSLPLLLVAIAAVTIPAAARAQAAAAADEAEAVARVVAPDAAGAFVREHLLK